MKLEDRFSTKQKKTDLMKWLKSMSSKELFTNFYIWAILKRLEFKNTEANTFGKEKRTSQFMIENSKNICEIKQTSSI